MAGDKDGTKAKILVIDDQPGMVDLIRQGLERHRYEVITATDGNQGLTRALAERPDLILLDVMMPGLDGFTAATELRQQSHSRIIILSGMSQRGLEDLFRGKVDGWVQKPFLFERLLQEVERVLGSRDA